jgi:hypothetical protein
MSVVVSRPHPGPLEPNLMCPTRGRWDDVVSLIPFSIRNIDCDQKTLPVLEYFENNYLKSFCSPRVHSIQLVSDVALTQTDMTQYSKLAMIHRIHH